MKIRDENITNELKRACRREILAKLDDLMRENPYGQTFQTAGEKIADAKARNGEIPKFQVSFFVLPYIVRSQFFQIILLTDRDLKTDALLGRADCTVIERADAPTSKQVAVIWVQDDGEAPLINGTIYFTDYSMFGVRHIFLLRYKFFCY